MNRPIMILMLVVSGSLALQAQVPYDRIVHSGQEPQNWLTHSGNYNSQRYSTLSQITPENVKNLEVQWIYQARSLEKFEATPIVADGIMYTVEAPNNIVALDAATGRVFWTFTHTPAQTARPCCGRVNRGLAILGDTLFMATIDARLIAVDAKNGRPLWNVAVAKPESGYAMTLAPLVVKDKVVVGTAGGEYGIRGFIDAYDAKTGKQAWRFYTIPGPGEPGNETWAGDSWQRGGASIWVKGAYDPELNLVYYGIGNPGPDYHSESRKGDNLYSDSLVALDADTGKLRWHYQFTPHDLHDWDSTEVPILADLTIAGQVRRVVMLANRNGFFYTLDRTNGKLIVGKPYVVTTWAKEVGADGRPVILPGYVPDEKGSLTCPDVTGATNFWPASYDPAQHLFFVNAREVCATFYAWKQEYVPGERYTGGAGQRATGPDTRAWGALRAIDPTTGERKWEFP